MVHKVQSSQVYYIKSYLFKIRVLYINMLQTLMFDALCVSQKFKNIKVTFVFLTFPEKE